MGKIDMHVHTSYSDGEYDANKVIKTAIEKGVTTLSITDHDNVRAYSSIDYERFSGQIELFTGIELSAKVSKGRLHILGYGVDVNDKDFLAQTDEIRRNNFYSMIALLNQVRLDYGIAFSVDEIQNIFNANHNIGRPDIATLLLKRGYVSGFQEAFKKYLNPSYEKVRDLNITKSPEECINIILKAHGIPVLAHPNQLLLDDAELLEKLKELINYGLMGVEVYHSGHLKNETEYYLELAKKYDLLISSGSDFHGPVVKPSVTIGVPETHELTLVNYLRKRK